MNEPDRRQGKTLGVCSVESKNGDVFVAKEDLGCVAGGEIVDLWINRKSVHPRGSCSGR